MGEAGEFSEWAVVEVMGHKRFAGRVTEAVVAGCGFVRVDVPATDEAPAFSKLLGTAAIYAITPCDEATCRAIVEYMQVRPIDVYIPTQLMARFEGDESEEE